MPDTVARDLKTAFDRLPPRAARFRSPQGLRFLHQVRQACTDWGAPQVGEAIGLSTASIYQICHRPLPHKLYEYPNEQQMQDVRQAWAAVVALRDAHRQVRRTTPEFDSMRTALKNLRRHINTDDVMIAVALGVEPAQLRFFDDPPRRARRAAR